MIHLCIDARMAFHSGIGTFIRALIPFFNAPPFKLTLLVDKPLDIACEQIQFNAKIYSLKEQVLFPFVIPSSDLFWSPHYNFPLFPIKAKKRIATIHDTCHLALGRVVEKAYAQIVMRKAVQSDLVTTVSDFSKSEIERYLGEGDIHTIPIGVDANHFRKVEDAEGIRKKYQLPKRFVLFVGNFKPHKNVQGLLAAFEHLKMPDIGLVLVGNGFMTNTSQAHVLNAVPNEELPAIYSLAELFVFPSFYEGFGLPPLEAMSCHCPTAVSSAASIPEVCQDASVYFHPNKAEDMAKTIQTVIENGTLRKSLIQKGIKRVQELTWEKTAARYLQLFEAMYA